MAAKWKKIGALWKPNKEKFPDTKTVLSGTLDLGPMGEVRITIFKNEPRDGHELPAGAPDFVITMSNDKSDGGSASSGSAGSSGEDLPF